MLLRFWGTRGSIPAPGPHTSIYGGNTSCVEVRTDDGTLIILDCGTGIRELGLQLLKSKQSLERVYMLIGHTHWDHIQGFPFFTPAFLPGTELNIFAPAGFQRSLEDSLSGQMQYSYFPVKLQDLSSRIHYTELEEGFFRIGDILVETRYLNHTAPTIAYRITQGKTTVAYVTDHEPYWDSPGPDFHHPGDQRHIAFLRGADLVIHDAQYSEEEYKTKHGWGHSTIDYATDVAIAAGVGRLALFHHDPTHDDNTVRGFEEHARARALAAGSSLDIFAAREGVQIEILGKSEGAALREEASALEHHPISGGRILVVSDTPIDVASIEQVLGEDGLIVTLAGNGRTAIERASQLSPDLVIIDSRLPDGDGASFIQPLRSILAKKELPILILTGAQDATGTLYSEESIATDYVAKPFSPPMLRSRVRSWLARTMSTNPDGAHLEESRGTAQPPAGDRDVENSSYPDILASVSLFRSLTSGQLQKMLTNATQRHYPAGHVIIRQGEPGHSVYVLLSGRVRIVEALPDSPVEMFLGEIGQGEVFGELGILRQRPRSATVIPLERTVCLLIPEADFLESLAEAPEMAMALLKVLAARLFDADRMLARYAPDPLTGLPGRRAFHELYRRLAAGARRRNSSVLLLAVDVVDLKTINDRFGYTIGDNVLRTVADALIDASRGTDLVARYGSDEFAALLLEADESDAPLVVQRVREKLRNMASQRGLPFLIECRIGYSYNAVPPETVEELLRAADRHMQSSRPGAVSN